MIGFGFLVEIPTVYFVKNRMVDIQLSHRYENGFAGAAAATIEELCLR